MTTTQMELLQGLVRSGMSENLKNAILRLEEGKAVLLLDSSDRENEGDLMVAAEKITPSSMNFLIKQGSGVVCLALPKERLDYLGLPLMIPENTNFFQTAFTVSIEAKTGVTTGVSASDRAHTIQTVMAKDCEPSHLARPGHVFPLAAQKNGVFDRMGHTEGSVDLMRIANLKPGAVLCELMNKDGSMTKGQDLLDFAKEFDIPMIGIEEIFFHRMRTEDIVCKVSKKIDTRFGQLLWHSFKFFETLTIEIFQRAAQDPQAKPTRLSLVSGNRLHHRFMAQVLQQNDDDPLWGALSKLRDNQIDLVAMASTNTETDPDHETNLKIHGALCRSLKELSLTQLAFSPDNQAFARVAEVFFSLPTIKL
jgi:3,4-dihydroxy-2-butanone 4-phosphate synthase